MESQNRGRNIGRMLLAGLAVLLCVGIWSWGSRAKDTFSVFVPNGMMAEGYESDTAAEFSGKRVAEFRRENVSPGRYTIYIPYETQTDGSWFEVVDWARGTVLAQGTYPAGQEAVSAAFEVQNGQPQIAVRSYQGEGYLRIMGYNLYSDGPVYTDTFWILGLSALLALFLLWCVRRQRAGHPRDLQLLLLSGAFSLPYLSSHLQNGHDMLFHVSRIAGLGAALRSGQFPVRLNYDLQNTLGGYVDPVMYPELFLYLSGVMCAWGASVLLATKVLLILINFLTAYCGYYGAKQFVGDTGGMIFTILYLCCPYRMNDVYIRAALGEALAMAFLPLAAAGIYQLMQGDHKKGFWTALLGITGILQSHILTMFLLVFFGGIYGIWVLLCQGKRFWSDKDRPLTLLAAAAATVLVNFWFLVPFLSYSRFDLNIFHEKGSLATSRIYLWQAFMESESAEIVKTDGSTSGYMPLSIGFVLLPIILLMLYRWLQAPGSNVQEVKKEKGLMALGTLALFMTSMLFPWDRLETNPIIEKTFAKLQLSWRLLMVAAVLYCLAAAAELLLLLKEKKQILTGVLLGFAVLTAMHAGSQYFFVNNPFMLDKTDDRPRYSYEGQYLLHQYDLYEMEAQAQKGVQPLTQNAQVTGAERQTTGTTFDFVNNDDGADAVFRVPQYNYTLHRAALADGQLLTVDTDPETGLMRVTVPAGIREGTVRVYYHEPLPYRLASGVTLLTAAALAVLWYRKRRADKSTAAPRGLPDLQPSAGRV